jgi:hypothetical protein
MTTSRHELLQDFLFMVSQFFRLLPVQICLGIVLYLFLSITTFRYLDQSQNKWPDGTYQSRADHHGDVFVSIIWPIYWAYKICYHSTDIFFDSTPTTKVKLERDR